METKQWHFDKIRLDKVDKSNIVIKTRSSFCICFRETEFGFNILFIYNLMVSVSGFWHPDLIFGLIKQGLRLGCSFPVK